MTSNARTQAQGNTSNTRQAPRNTQAQQGNNAGNRQAGNAGAQSRNRQQAGNAGTPQQLPSAGARAGNTANQQANAGQRQGNTANQQQRNAANQNAANSQRQTNARTPQQSTTQGGIARLSDGSWMYTTSHPSGSSSGASGGRLAGTVPSMMSGAPNFGRGQNVAANSVLRGPELDRIRQHFARRGLPWTPPAAGETLGQFVNRMSGQLAAKPPAARQDIRDQAQAFRDTGAAMQAAALSSEDLMKMHADAAKLDEDAALYNGLVSEYMLKVSWASDPAEADKSAHNILGEDAYRETMQGFVDFFAAMRAKAESDAWDLREKARLQEYNSRQQ